MSNDINRAALQVVQQNLGRLISGCTGCCFTHSCENDSPRDFSRFCTNIIDAAILGNDTFEHPTQIEPEEMNERPVTEHPDVQRLIIQVETLSQENKIMRAMLVAEGLLDE